MIDTNCRMRYFEDMGKTATLGMRLTPDVKDALERAASRDMRSMSAMLEKIAIEWLRANGYLSQ